LFYIVLFAYVLLVTKAIFVYLWINKFIRILAVALGCLLFSVHLWTNILWKSVVDECENLFEMVLGLSRSEVNSLVI